MKTVKIATFLTERKIKIKPHEANKSELQRIEKIDFDGNIYLAPIQTNTDMIVVKKGDLVISGINVEKGALAIYHGEKDVLASIHYSAYEFDKEQIDIIYLKWFLKSRIFKKLLLEQTGSGIKKEIKAKHILPIKIELPSLRQQQEIVKNIVAVERNVVDLDNEIQRQEKYVSSLRQAILQQAVEGKLCKQDSGDEPASVLLERIKEEKEKLIAEKKIKNQKALPPIIEEETPFDLPHGWEWCRLGTLLSDLKYGTSAPCDYNSANTPVLRIPNIDTMSNSLDLSDLKYGKLKESELLEYQLENGDILIIRSNGSASLVGRAALVNNVKHQLCYAGYLIRIRTFKSVIDTCFLINVLNCRFLRLSIEIPIRTTTGVKNINSSEISSLLIPLPPLAEQQRIVEKVDRLMVLCDELAQEVTKAKKHASQLMEVVLQEAFAIKPEETQSNVVVFTPLPQQEEQPLMAAARGNMKEDTWQRLAKRALELANEES